jgi:4'-phosphopantetheinyl transferase
MRAPCLVWPTDSLSIRCRQVGDKVTCETCTSPLWCSPPDVPVLYHGEVHAWRASLVVDASRTRSFEQSLSADERERAERFQFREGYEYFVAARGTLRAILGRYLDVEPGQIRFRYGSQGKPVLAERSGGDNLRFNLSHSHGLAILAVTWDREVGVDLEYIRDDVAIEQIAERFFSDRERTALRALSAVARREAFFACWTRKEAYIKARGEGLGIGLDGFDVSLTPGESDALLSVRDNPDEAARWSLRELNPGAGFAAALAVEGHDWRLQCWQFQEAQCHQTVALSTYLPA